MFNPSLRPEILPWLAVLLLLFGCSQQPDTAQTSPEDTAGLTNPPSPPETPPRQFTALERQIHDFFQTTGDTYQAQFTTERGEAIALVATSKEFHKPLIEVARIYDSIEATKTGVHVTDAEDDAINLKRFREVGFTQRDGTWYYSGEAVDMGTPLPTPESMKPSPPEPGRQIDVNLSVDSTVSELKTLRVKGRTNLPDQTELAVVLSCPELNYTAADKAIVTNGEFESGPFADARRPLRRLASGRYTIEISTPTVTVLNQSAAKAVGERGKNVTGKLVQFDEIMGNRVFYSKVVDIP